MISTWWLIPAVLVGIAAGVFALALVHDGRR